MHIEHKHLLQEMVAGIKANSQAIGALTQTAVEIKEMLAEQMAANKKAEKENKKEDSKKEKTT